MKSCPLLIVSLFAAPFFVPVSHAQLVSTSPVNPQDPKNCSDSVVVPRLPNSTLTACDSKPGVSLQIPSGKDASGSPTLKSVSGDSQEWDYKAPKDMTADQIFTSMETVLKNAGFSVVFEDSPRTITATKQGSWCEMELSANDYKLIIVNSTETKPAADGGSLTADVLDKGGRVPIKGVHFDAQGAIASGSDAALGEIAALLTRDPSLKLRIEAYSYNASDPAGNLFLSQKEAAAVVDWLAAHGVDKNRLAPQGLGAASPIEEAINGGQTARNHELDIMKVQ